MSIREFQQYGNKQQLHLIDQEHAHPPPFVQEKKTYTCLGIRIQYLAQTVTDISRTQLIVDGYSHLIRQAIRARADNIRDGIYPEYYTGVHGIILSNGGVRLLLKEKDTTTNIKSVNEMFYFTSTNCKSLSENDDSIHCSACKQLIPFIKRKCLDTVHMRAEGITHSKTNNKFLYTSPSLICHKIDRLANNAKIENVKRYRAKAKLILKVVTDKDGVNLSGANLEEVFPANLQHRANKFFDKEKISQDNLARYLFQESYIQARTAIKSKNKACRYSPVMIRFCIGIRDKLKKGKYEFLRKVFNLPSARTLAHYDSIGGNEPDGLLYSVLHTIQHEYNLKEETDDWLKMVSLKFDACHIADKVKYNPHTNQLVGFSYNAFDKDVLLEDLNKLTNTVTDDDNKIVNENRAQQYLIFMINRWEKNSKPLKYVVARYAVGAGVSSTLLLSEIPKIICGLYTFGIIVTNVTADGASEIGLPVDH